MATCYQKHPFEIESEDHLSNLNTKIFEIKKKIQLSEGQRKSHFEENENERRQNAEKIEALKKEIKDRLQELANSRAVVGGDQIRLKKFFNEFCPIGNKTADQLMHSLDLKVTEQRKQLDVATYYRKKKRVQLKKLEKEYEQLLIDSTKSTAEKKKDEDPSKKAASHLENEIHRVTIQLNEAEHVRKKYSGIRQSLINDAVKFDSSLANLEDMMRQQCQEIKKLESVNEEACWLRARAAAALGDASAAAAGADESRARELAYFAQRFDERRRELERIERRIFPQVRTVIRQDSAGSGDLNAVAEEDQPLNPAALMDQNFQKLMKVTGVIEPSQVMDRFEGQRETSQRLDYLRRATEQQKSELETRKAAMVRELEAHKYAEVKDKEESSDQIEEVNAAIESEKERCVTLRTKMKQTRSVLLDIKNYFYDFCLKLELLSQPHPPLPVWNESIEDLEQILEVFLSRYTCCSSRLADIMLNGDELLLQFHVEPIPQKSPRHRGATNETTQNTPRSLGLRSDDDSRPTPGATMSYKELLEREPPKPPASDEEEEIPSRSYLKRQAQLIIDTKCRRKGFRIQYPRK